jgi:hypothetical protein
MPQLLMPNAQSLPDTDKAISGREAAEMQNP